MKYLIGFLTGALFGAAVALLLAPQSGEDLRNRLRAEAESQYQRVQEQTQKGMAQLHEQVDKLTSEVQAATSKAKGAGKSS